MCTRTDTDVCLHPARCRSDLEKAILAHGGMAAVAKALGWPVKARQRRPNGYWDEVDNVRQEIDAFIRASGLQPGA